MDFKLLDTVVLDQDQPQHGLRRGDLGAVVEIHEPDGLEVESLTGAALHHWSELSEGDQRRIILHLNGKTIGSQTFSLTLSGPAPTDAGDWAIPRFELNEATRQSGELVVRPTTGIRLRTVSRQNVSETDPRSVGGKGQGALAFRLLQRDWNLVLGIEKLAVDGKIVFDRGEPS